MLKIFLLYSYIKFLGSYDQNILHIWFKNTLKIAQNANQCKNFRLRRYEAFLSV